MNFFFVIDKTIYGSYRNFAIRKNRIKIQIIEKENFLFQTLKNLIFCKDIKPIVRKRFNILNIQIEFVKFDGIYCLRKIENILPVIDASCEEVYNDKEFVKLATAGRHKGFYVIYVKHNLFQQSRCSRTIDLNTYDIILFKSPLDIQLLDHIGRQLNVRNFYEIRMSWLQRTAWDIYL